MTGEVIVGGFGDVRQAKLRTSLFGKDPVVALKDLRPTGNREQRIPVVAVSGCSGPEDVSAADRELYLSRSHES